MFKDQYYIFDLDGTLTYTQNQITDTSGLRYYALSDVINERLSRDNELFCTFMQNWADKKIDHVDKKTLAIEFNQIIIANFHEENKNALAIFNAAFEITSIFIQHGIINLQAIEFFVSALKLNKKCIISTASFEEGAKGFIAALIKNELIPKEYEMNILYSGTVINCDTLKIDHYNSGAGKVHGIERLFGSAIESWLERVSLIVGDEPCGGDFELLNLNTYCFGLIKSVEEKNYNITPHNCVWTTWEGLVENYDNIPAFHGQLKDEQKKDKEDLIDNMDKSYSLSFFRLRAETKDKFKNEMLHISSFK